MHTFHRDNTAIFVPIFYKYKLLKFNVFLRIKINNKGQMEAFCPLYRIKSAYNDSPKKIVFSRTLSIITSFIY